MRGRSNVGLFKMYLNKINVRIFIETRWNECRKQDGLNNRGGTFVTGKMRDLVSDGFYFSGR